MRQAIRALGWGANIFWIILLLFTATAVYSAFQIASERGIGFGEPYTNTLDGTLTVSFPFYINNVGLYDISDVSVTTRVKDNNGSLISDSSTPPRLIPCGSNVTVTYNVSISLSQMTTGNLSYLLFYDSEFDVEVALKLNYANAVPFEISTNFPMPWGAPLNNITIGTISVSPYNATHFRAIVPVSFENHSLLSLDGTTRLELVDNTNSLLGSGIASIPSQGGYVPLEVFVSNLTNIREARLYFDTSLFSYGPVVILLV